MYFLDFILYSFILILIPILILYIIVLIIGSLGSSEYNIEREETFLRVLNSLSKDELKFQIKKLESFQNNPNLKCDIIENKLNNFRKRLIQLEI